MLIGALLRVPGAMGQSSRRVAQPAPSAGPSTTDWRFFGTETVAEPASGDELHMCPDRPEITTFQGWLVGMLYVFAQFERQLIIERVRSGMSHASFTSCVQFTIWISGSGQLLSK
jgi:hypothetical protein